MGGGAFSSGLFFAAICCGVGGLLLFPKFTIDDAYITFRYADNLAHHSQFTWNIGEPPVEGYTGVLLPLVLALFIHVGLSPILVSKVIGAASFLLGGAMMAALLSRAGTRRSIRGLVLMLYFGAPFMFVHALSGLETALFSTLILACMLSLLRCIESPGRGASGEVALVVLLLCLSLTRPEGVVAAAVFFIAVGVAKVVCHQPGKARFAALVLALYGLPGLAYVMWKLCYYGQVLPNSYYAKVYLGPHIINPGALKDLRFFALSYLAAPVVVSLALLAWNPARAWLQVRRAARASKNPFAVVWIASLAFMSVVLFQYLRSTLEMNFSFRFFMPLYGIMLVTVGVLGEAGWKGVEQAGKRGGRRTILAALVVVAGALLQLALWSAMLRRDIQFYGGHRERTEKVAVPAAEFLRRHVPPKEWLVVHIDAGAVPYYSGLKTVDFGALNDPILSRKAGLSSEEIVDYFYASRPGALLFTSYEWDHLSHGAEAAAIADDDRFKEYALVRKFRCPESVFQYAPRYFDEERLIHYYYFVFLRNDLAAAAERRR